jgi:hypothetical protein
MAKLLLLPFWLAWLVVKWTAILIVLAVGAIWLAWIAA